MEQLINNILPDWQESACFTTPLNDMVNARNSGPRDMHPVK